MCSDVPVHRAPQVTHGVFLRDPGLGTLLVLGRSGVRNNEWPWIRADGLPPGDNRGWCYASELATRLVRDEARGPPNMVVLCAIQHWTVDEVLQAKRTAALSGGATRIRVGIQGDLAALGRGDCSCEKSLQALSRVPRSPLTPPVVPQHSHHVATLHEAWDWYNENVRTQEDDIVVVVTLEPELAVQHHVGGLRDLREPNRWVFVGASRSVHRVVDAPAHLPLGFLTCQKFQHARPKVVPRCNAKQATYVTPSQFRELFGWVHCAIMLMDVPLALQCRVAARCRHAVCTVRCRKLSNDRLPFAFLRTDSATPTQGP